MTDTKTDFLRSLFDMYDKHIDRFAKVVSLPKEIDTQLEIEPLLRNTDGTPLRDGVLNLPVHCDFAEINNRGRFEKNLSIPKFCEAELGNISLGSSADVRATSFLWNALDVRFKLDDGWPNFKPLRHWYLDWNLEKSRLRSTDLRGVLHRLNGPTPTKGGWIINLDLGTSPPEAVLTLIETLEDIGAHSLELGCCLAADVN